MLTVNQISKRFGDELVLDRVTFTINAGECQALIGPNGCGKSTLLSIIAGRLEPDQGSVSVHPENLAIGYLPQGHIFQDGDSISSFLDRYNPGSQDRTNQLQDLARKISAAPHSEELQVKYDRLLAEVSLAGEFYQDTLAALRELGLGDISTETLVSQLSGGQQTRLMLASALRRGPQLLVLDEPTNHLDLSMLDWLEERLLSFQGGILYVSHDRAFINHTATGVLELDLDTRNVKQYPGNYSDYLNAKLKAREKQQQAYTNQQAEISRLRGAVERRKGEAKYKKGGKADSDKFAKGYYRSRSSGTIKRAKQLEKRIEYLLTEGRVEKPSSSWQLKIDFDESVDGKRRALVLNGLSIGYGNTVLLKNINQEIRLGERIALIGENGSGKTTLIRTILNEIPPLLGQSDLGKDIQIGYMAQDQTELDQEKNILESLLERGAFSETEARRFLSYFLFTGDEVFKIVSRLSYGERARISLAGIVASGCNFLILDEPINHLDIPSRSRFEKALTVFKGAILAVVHDRFFIDGFATRVWEVSGDKLNSKTAVGEL